MEPIRDSFLSSDGKNKVAYYIWAPESPRAVIQLSHGMCEYVERYAGHAEYFVSQGFVFCGNDHLGHGNTAASPDDLGFIGSNECLVDDLAKMTDIIKEKYPGLPVVLFGHSMGSFAARLYITKYADKLAGAIISGTAGTNNPTGLGKAVAKLLSFGKPHRRSELVKSIAMSGYNKRFPNAESRSAWITSVDDVVRVYDKDPFCNYTFTTDGYYNLFDMLGKVSAPDWGEKLPKELPVLLIAGKEDPVGNYGEGVKEVYGIMKKAGVTDLTIKLWDGARHELLNETDEIRESTYACITDWIGKRI